MLKTKATFLVYSAPHISLGIALLRGHLAKDHDTWKAKKNALSTTTLPNVSFDTSDLGR